MKIQVLTTAALIAVFAASTASAGRLNINTSNASTNAIAVGDTVVVSAYADWDSASAFIGAAGGRPLAGSVQVNAGRSCGCRGGTNVRVNNRSNGAIAVGRASAGSTQINL